MIIHINEDIVNSVWTDSGVFRILPFYENVARKIQTVDDNTTFDCRHIEITPSIQEMWINHYKEIYNTTDIADLMMVLLMVGPKATIESDDPFTVNIESGFITK